MAAAPLNIVIERGATFRLPLRLRDGDGQLLDLSGCSARMQVRAKLTDASPVLDLTTENGGITLTADGWLRVRATDEATDVLTITRGVYDLELEWPSGDVDRLFKGKVTVDPSVTR
jgi:hypothetical protein